MQSIELEPSQHLYYAREEGSSKGHVGMQLTRMWKYTTVKRGMKEDKPKPLTLVTDNYSRILEIHKGSVLMMADLQLGRNSNKNSQVPVTHHEADRLCAPAGLMMAQLVESGGRWLCLHHLSQLLQVYMYFMQLQCHSDLRKSKTACVVCAGYDTALESYSLYVHCICSNRSPDFYFFPGFGDVVSKQDQRL